MIFFEPLDLRKTIFLNRKPAVQGSRSKHAVIIAMAEEELGAELSILSHVLRAWFSQRVDDQSAQEG